MKTKEVVLMGLLVALEIVLSRFLSIQALTIRIGFSFIAIALAGMMLGPIKAGIVAGVADVLGLFLFSTGVFNPGITLDAILVGVIYGVFLKDLDTRHIVSAVLFNGFGVSLCLQSLWLSKLYEMPYESVLVSRIPQVLILIPIQIVVVKLICNKRIKNLLSLS